MIRPFVSAIKTSLIVLQTGTFTRMVLPNWKKVAIEVMEGQLDMAVAPKIAWEDAFNENDLCAIVQQFRLDMIFGMELVIITDRENQNVRTHEEMLIWKDNLRKLHVHLKTVMGRPRPQRAVTGFKYMTKPHQCMSSAASSQAEPTKIVQQPAKPMIQGAQTKLKLADLPNDMESLRTFVKEETELVAEMILNQKRIKEKKKKKKKKGAWKM